VAVGLETQNITKALTHADKQGLTRVIILGLNEARQGIYNIKDMDSGKETKHKL